ncbi:MAG: ABC transporter substrate-binding protein [Bacillota bacterium]
MIVGRKWLAALVFILLAFAAGCYGKSIPEGPQSSPASPEYSLRILRVGLVDKLYSLDPSAIATWDELFVATQIHEGLVLLSSDGSIKPGLASAWEVNKGGTQYVFHLSPEARFSNGRKITSRDVKLSWERSARIRPDTVLPLLKSVKGMPAGLNGVEAKGDNSLVIELETPDPFLLHSLSHPLLAVVDLQPTNTSVGIPGCGPFQVVEWIPGEMLTLEKNPEYHGPQQIIERIEIRWEGTAPENALVDFSAGDLDLVVELPAMYYRHIVKEPFLESSLRRYRPSGSKGNWPANPEHPFGLTLVAEKIEGLDADALGRLDLRGIVFK